MRFFETKKKHSLSSHLNEKVIPLEWTQNCTIGNYRPIKTAWELKLILDLSSFLTGKSMFQPLWTNSQLKDSAESFRNVLKTYQFFYLSDVKKYWPNLINSGDHFNFNYNTTIFHLYNNA